MMCLYSLLLKAMRARALCDLCNINDEIVINDRSQCCMISEYQISCPTKLVIKERFIYLPIVNLVSTDVIIIHIQTERNLVYIIKRTSSHAHIMNPVSSSWLNRWASHR
ncbi:hypothetical protein ABW21_db0204871 [Orbilia brochopaga]|nr:hypothetical protein ABW21_db0204871 [Drechslerella brochopaga]